MVCKCGHEMTEHHLNKNGTVFTWCFVAVKPGFPPVFCSCVKYEEDV